ncbi:hypothetical protein SLA2020_092870 [Shorea laevis]
MEGSSRSREADQVTENLHYIELRRSICKGEWDGVKQFFVDHKHPLNTIILSDYTALHVAIKSGQDTIAEELVNMMSETDLEMRKGRPGAEGHTPLSLAAWTGRTHVAKCLVQKNSKLLTIETNKGYIPVTVASSVGNKEMTKYLYSITPHDIYGPEKRLKVKLPTTSSGEVQIAVPRHQSHNQKNIKRQAFGLLCGFGLMLLNFFGIKQIYDLKLKHLYAVEILQCMCNHLSTLKEQHRVDCGVVEAIFEASKQGMVEFVIELLKINQPLIYNNKDGRNVFMVAIQYRQENIFNLFYGIHEAWKTLILNRKDVKGNNTLHVAGEIAPHFQLARITSPALQMQRELQWFKEVERIVPEWCKEAKNFRDGEKPPKTPYEVFSESHKELVQEGGKWMKETASSFIIVGTLIVTIMFAAAFTVPGGNDQNSGFPIFLRKRSFMIFIISDAISFFAASTSVLMFLGILTSRFAQEDFLVSLPKKLMIGLSTLFISIAAMMVSFCAALLIMLHNRQWAIIPIILMASIPVTLFVWLQYPLLVEIFVSTYTSKIFDRKMKPWL